MMQSAAMVVMTYCMAEQVMTHYKVVQVKIPWQEEPETTDCTAAVTKPTPMSSKKAMARMWFPTVLTRQTIPIRCASTVPSLPKLYLPVRVTTWSSKPTVVKMP